MTEGAKREKELNESACSEWPLRSGIWEWNGIRCKVEYSAFSIRSGWPDVVERSKYTVIFPLGNCWQVSSLPERFRYDWKFISQNMEGSQELTQ
jgi:hypothetical protein